MPRVSGRNAALSSVLTLALCHWCCFWWHVGALQLCRELPSSTVWTNCKVQVGGLSIQGEEAFMTQFAPLFEDYLTAQLNASSGIVVEALPLSFHESFDFVEAVGVDLIFTNPAAYTCLMVEHGVRTVASMVNYRKGNSLERFAGVIFTRENSSFYTVEDLKRARIEAVSIAGLGAMQLQQATLLTLGFDVMADAKRLSFSYNQNLIVEDVESGYADVGFVRTDMIDRLVAAGTTTWDKFRILFQIEDPTFPFRRSTSFTPEWPLGALDHVPYSVSQEFASHLYQLDRFSSDPLYADPGIAGGFATFVNPMNYMTLLVMLETIGYYNPEEMKCMRSTDVYEAVICPEGYVKQTAERAFCDDCKDGYDCLCSPCTKLMDPALVLTVEGLETEWPPTVDAEEAEASVILEKTCLRMERCVSVPTGKKIRWVLTDEIGAVNRAKINAELLTTVEFRWRFDCEWQVLVGENFTTEGGVEKQRYVWEGEAQDVGTHVSVIRINGEQAEMSPVISIHSTPPARAIVCELGQQGESDGTCTACPPGTYGYTDESGSEVVYGCRACIKGTYQPDYSQTDCIACDAGSIAATEGATTCSLCPSGSSTLGREGRSACEACEPGQEASEEGLARCSSCPRGRYSSSEGSSQCDECQGGMTTQDVGSRNISSCACAEGSFLALAKTGEWLCRNCPSPGATCPGFGLPPLLEKGYFMFDDSSRTAWDLDVWRCQSESACPGQSSVDDNVCSHGLLGLNCAKCPRGQYRTRLSTCGDCAVQGVAAAMIAVFCMVLAFLMVGVIAYGMCRRGASSTMVLTVAGLLLTFMQTISVFSWLKFAWSTNVKWFFTSATWVLLDVREFRTSCIMEESAAAAYLLPLTLPLLVISAILGWKPCSRLLRQATSERMPELQMTSLLNLVGAFLTALFISIVSTTVALFDCYSSPNGKETVRTMPYTICWSGEHLSLVPLAAVAVLVYVLGVLSVLLVVIFKAPEWYANQYFRSSFDFLFMRYQARTWWFGIVVLCRSTFLALVTVISPDNSFLQFNLVLLTLVCSLMAHLIWMPYKNRMPNFLEGFQFFMLMMIMGVGSWFMSDAGHQERVSDEKTGQILSAIIIICIALNILVLGVGLSVSLVFNRSSVVEELRTGRLHCLTAEWKAISRIVASMDQEHLTKLVARASHLDRSSIRGLNDFVLLEQCHIRRATLRGRRLPSVEAVVDGKVVSAMEDLEAQKELHRRCDVMSERMFTRVLPESLD